VQLQPHDDATIIAASSRDALAKSVRFTARADLSRGESNGATRRDSLSLSLPLSFYLSRARRFADRVRSLRGDFAFSGASNFHRSSANRNLWIISGHRATIDRADAGHEKQRKRESEREISFSFSGLLAFSNSRCSRARDIIPRCIIN